MGKWLKELAREYGRGWEYIIIDNYDNYVGTLTAEMIEDLDDEDNAITENVVVNTEQRIIYCYLL